MQGRHHSTEWVSRVKEYFNRNHELDMLRPPTNFEPLKSVLSESLSYSPYLGDYAASLQVNPDPKANPVAAIEALTSYFNHMCAIEPNVAYQHLFSELRFIKSLVLHLDIGRMNFVSAVPQETLRVYQSQLRRFVTTWKVIAMNMLEAKFSQLRHALRTHEFSFDAEHWFHSVFLCMGLLYPFNPKRPDSDLDRDYLPVFIGLVDYQSAHVQLRRHYQEFQCKTYSSREDTKLWLLIWRSLKLINWAYDDENGFGFLGDEPNGAFAASKEFFDDCFAETIFEDARVEVGVQAVQYVETLVGHYCVCNSRAKESGNPTYTAISDRELSVAEEWELNELLAKQKVSAELLRLLQRAAIRLIAIKQTRSEFFWHRTSSTAGSTTWPQNGSQVVPLPTEMTSEVIMSNLDGHDQISSYDFVHYPFPETRAHEVAASEQITREMSEPGLVSDGARVEHVVNRPQKHVRPPSNVSSWSPFRFRGPIGLMCALVRTSWKWKFGRRRPTAKSRARLTPRPDRRKTRAGPLSPRRDSARKVSKTTALPPIPKLRGGGPKAPSGSLRTPERGSGRRTSQEPRRPSVSPITDDGSSTNTRSENKGSGSSNHGPTASLTDADKAGGLNRFKQLTRLDRQTLLTDDQIARTYLDPNNWNVDTAAQVYIANVQERRRSHIAANHGRDNSGSPTPRQRGTPLTRIVASPQVTRIKNTAPRPGMNDDIHDDSSTSSESGILAADQDSDQDITEFSSAFADPSLIRSNAPANSDDEADDFKDEDDFDEAEYHVGGAHERDSDETEDLYEANESHAGGQWQPPTSLSGSDKENASRHGSSNKENTTLAVPQIFRRPSHHEPFDIFEDVTADVQQGRAPSTAAHRGLFDHSGIPPHPVPPLNVRPPLAPRPTPRDSGERLPQGPMENGMNVGRDEDAEDQTEQGDTPDQAPPAPVRQPLGTLDDHGTPSSADPSPAIPENTGQNAFKQCHPCPHYKGHYHHFCHCPGPIYSPLGLPIGLPRDVSVRTDTSARTTRSLSRQRATELWLQRTQDAHGQVPQQNVGVPYYHQDVFGASGLPAPMYQPYMLYPEAYIASPSRQYPDGYLDYTYGQHPASPRLVELLRHLDNAHPVVVENVVHAINTRNAYAMTNLANTYAPRGIDQADLYYLMTLGNAPKLEVDRSDMEPEQRVVPARLHNGGRMLDQPPTPANVIQIIQYFQHTGLALLVNAMNTRDAAGLRALVDSWDPEMMGDAELAWFMDPQQWQPIPPGSGPEEVQQPAANVKKSPSTERREARVLTESMSRSARSVTKPPTASPPAKRTRTHRRRDTTESASVSSHGSRRSTTRSRSRHSAVAAPAAQPRAPLTAATYLATMFRDEMIEELRARGIPMVGNETARVLARMLHEADLAGNLGLANIRSFRMITGEIDAKRRPTGWKMPPRPQ